MDTEVGMIHIFKTLNIDRPSESLSLFGGKFPDKTCIILKDLSIYLIEIISDLQTGVIFDSFEF
jgi:hypothetical protein